MSSSQQENHPIATMANVGKPTLMHLQNSSSQAVLWLLEELGIDYSIRKFDRPTGLAPPELKETHPQGKSPQLITADGQVITQMSAIALYLLRTYDTAHRFHRPTDDPVREERLVCMGICDIAFKGGAKTLLLGIATHSPFFVRPILNRVSKTMDAMLFDPDIKILMELLEGELEGREWFMGGDAPSRPDFLLKFFVDMLVHPKFVTLDEYPKLAAWQKRCEERDAWKRALEKGNGYTMDWPSLWARSKG